MKGTTTDEASECCLASGGAGPGRGASALVPASHNAYTDNLSWHSRRGTPRAKMGQRKRATLSREEEELAIYSLNNATQALNCPIRTQSTKSKSLH